MLPWAEIVYRDRSDTGPIMSTKKDAKPTYFMTSDRMEVDQIFKRYKKSQDDRPSGQQAKSKKGERMQKKQKQIRVNVQWDATKKQIRDSKLPKTVNLPLHTVLDGMHFPEMISDYISQKYGFALLGWNFVSKKYQKEWNAKVFEFRNARILQGMKKKGKKSVKYYTKKSKGKSPRTLYYQEIDGVNKRISKQEYEARLQKHLKKVDDNFAKLGALKGTLLPRLRKSKFATKGQTVHKDLPDLHQTAFAKSFGLFLELEEQFAFNQVQKELAKIIKIGRNPLTRKRFSKHDLAVLKNIKKSLRSQIQSSKKQKRATK